MSSSSIRELSDRPDLWALCVHLSALQKKVKYFTLERVALYVQQLASKMRAQIPADILHTMCFVAIPRGGILVMGELAYALNVPHQQFFDDGVSPVCLIDDCALTGKRFGQMLRCFDDRDVWFCHLASAPELRESILHREPMVRGCIAASDLLVQQGGVWEQKQDEGRYLYSSVEPVAFPWTEPGLLSTLPFKGEIEGGWRLLPPHLVLGNLAMLNLPPKVEPVSVDIQASSQAVWRLAEDTVLLYVESNKSLFELSGLASKIWKGCVGYQNRNLTVRWAVSENQGIQPDEIEVVIDELLAKKLLVQI